MDDDGVLSLPVVVVRTPSSSAKGERVNEACDDNGKLERLELAEWKTL